MSNNSGDNWTEQPTYAMPPTGGAPGQAPGQQGQVPGQIPGQAAPYQQPYQSQPPSAQPVQGQPYQSVPQGGWNSQGQQAPYQSQPQSQPAYASQPPAWQQNQAGQPGFNQQPFGASPTAKSAGGIGKTMGWGIVVTSLLAMIGCFGTWVSIKFGGSMLGDISASSNGLGMESSSLPHSSSSSSDEKILAGWFILVPALIALGIGVMRALGKLPKVAAFGAALMGLIGAGMGIYKWSDIHSNLVDARNSLSSSGVSTGSFEGSVGWGLMLATIACLGLIITSVLSALKD